MSVSLPARNHTSDLPKATLFPQRAAATSQSLYLKQETSDPETFHSRLFITSTEKQQLLNATGSSDQDFYYLLLRPPKSKVVYFMKLF